MKGLQTLHEASLVRQQHTEECEAGGNVQIHDRPSRKEARSKKKHDRCGRNVEDSSNEAGGDDETYDKPSHKEVRSKKSMIIVKEKWMVVPMRQVVTIKLLTGLAPRRRDLRKSTIVVEEKWMMAPMKMMVDLQHMLLLLMMMPRLIVKVTTCSFLQCG
jgi:hypothetical protein